MSLLEKLAGLANKLDALGQFSAANEIDNILKEAGLADWFKPKQNMPTCTCQCESCQYGRDAVGRPQIAYNHHMECSVGTCSIKQQAQKA